MNSKWIKLIAAVVLVAAAMILGNEDMISAGWGYVMSAVGMIAAGVGVKQS